MNLGSVDSLFKKSSEKEFEGGLLGNDNVYPIDTDNLNSSFKKFSTRFEGLVPEQQCFGKVYIQAPVKDGSDAKAVFKGLELLTWVSLGMPASVINFRASSETLYNNVFEGISPPEFINVSYQDFNDLQITASLWDFYYSQFTESGYRIRRPAMERAFILYSFFDFYHSALKDYSLAEPLWEVRFEGVVFKEPQLSGLSPTLGNLSRSFQFSFDRYYITIPKAEYKNSKIGVVYAGSPTYVGIDKNI
jgi:hypothetical protein